MMGFSSLHVQCKAAQTTSCAEGNQSVAEEGAQANATNADQVHAGFGIPKPACNGFAPGG